MTSAGKPKSHLSRWLFFIALFLSGCGSEVAPVKFSGATMGTSYHVTYLPAASVPPPVQVQAQLDEILLAVNASMSTYLPDSEINRFNRAPLQQWHSLSADFMAVLTLAEEVNHASGGLYDVTVGPLVQLWGFGSTPASDTLPSAAAIARNLALVGQAYVSVDVEGRRAKRERAVQLDFSSIAKGYAVDLMAEQLQRLGVHNYLVEVGGELRVAGLNPLAKPWRIAVEQPHILRMEVAATVLLRDVAVATSGDYRNFFEHDGQRYSHTIDPRSGYPVSHELVSVTVIHPRAAVADAWATAFTAMGAAEALRVAQQRGLAVYLIRRGDSGFVVDFSAAFAPYLE